MITRKFLSAPNRLVDMDLDGLGFCDDDACKTSLSRELEENFRSEADDSVKSGGCAEFASDGPSESIKS
jgi:hypothetical protein